MMAVTRNSVPETSDGWRGLRVVVLGLGVTGFSAADALTDVGAEVTVLAGSASAERIDVLGAIGVDTRVTGSDADAIAEIVRIDPDVVVVSPGYRPDSALILALSASDTPVIGDIDLAWCLRDLSPRRSEWICITGTDGKTTTTQLTAAMIAASGRSAAVCGNIGVPVLDRIRDPEGFDYLVVELSSFQLHYTDRIVPFASACLNIADDHIDWHGSKEAYVAAKAKVFERVTSICVYNADDPVTRTLIERADVAEGARAVGFTLGAPGVSMLGVAEGILCDRAFIDARWTHAREIVTVDALAASGLAATHLVADVLAASALAMAAGASDADIRTALAGFTLGAHRIQPVADRGGVLFVDDSKATNSHSANASLGAFDSVVWIVGGLLKGVDIAPLVTEHHARLRGVVVIGVDQTPVLDALARHAPDVPVVQVDAGETGGVMTRAVRGALSLARPGDVILLAPAAASMDQFRDYADRGEAFAAAAAEACGGEQAHGDDSSANAE